MPKRWLDQVCLDCLIWSGAGVHASEGYCTSRVTLPKLHLQIKLSSNQSLSVESIHEETCSGKSDAASPESLRTKGGLHAEQRWLSGWHSLGHLPALHCKKNTHFFSSQIQTLEACLPLCTSIPPERLSRAVTRPPRWLAASSGCRWKRAPPR